MAMMGVISGLAGPEAGLVARAAIDTAASVGGHSCMQKVGSTYLSSRAAHIESSLCMR
jgi:hypothetical protein